MGSQISKSGIEEHLGAGIVLTGGTANMGNFISLVKFRTGMDARKGNLVLHLNEKNKEFIHPDNYTVLGLLNMTTEKTNAVIQVKPKKKQKKKIVDFLHSFRKWFREF